MRSILAGLALLVAPAAAHASVSAMGSLSCIPGSTVAQTANAPVTASLSDSTGAAAAQATPYSSLAAQSQAKDSGLGCLYDGSASEIEFLHLQGVAAGQSLLLHVAVPVTIAVQASSNPAFFSLAQGRADYSIATSMGMTSGFERLIVDSGIVSPLSELSHGVDVTLTPYFIIAGETAPIYLDKDDLAYLKFSGELKLQFENATLAHNFSVDQATLLTALLAASNLPSKGFLGGPVTIGFDYGLSSHATSVTDVTLLGGGSDILELFTNALSGTGLEAMANSSITLGNPLAPSSRYRFYVDDDYAGSLADVGVQLSYGDTSVVLPVERRADVFGAVPEPSTWGMMIVGFGMVGGAARRRNARGFASA